ncbi:NAD(P)H-dependent oxidoreductase [bacterium]|nr:NAD(P)H-dependent oxidoreductase [bacterium]
MRILVVYHSQTGNTEKMAEAIGQGAEEAGGSLIVAPVDQIPPHIVNAAQAVIFGSPCYFGNMCWKIKRLIDQTASLIGEFTNKIGGYFVSSGSKKDGEMTLYFLRRALEVHKMRIVPGILCVGTPTEEILEECRRYGAQIAQMEI